MGESSSHRIRLAGPWEWRKKSSDQNQRIKMPMDLADLFANQSENIILSRTFHSPTGITNEKLFLIIPSAYGPGSIHLNNQPLGSITEYNCDIKVESRFEITTLIEKHNRVEIELYFDSETNRQSSLQPVVYLEIVDSQDTK